MKPYLPAMLAINLLVLGCKPKPVPPSFSNSKQSGADSEADDTLEDFPSEDDSSDGSDSSEDESGSSTDTPSDSVTDGSQTSSNAPSDNSSTSSTTPTTTTPVDPNKKLEIKVQGRQLLVDGKAFHMRGICWNPVAKGNSQEKGTIFANPGSAELKAIEKDFQMMTAAGINTIRTYSVIENDKVLALLNKYGLFVVVPVLNVHNVTMDEVKRIVNKLKSHRSTLMWQVGNEWNYNLLYGSPNMDAAKGIVKTAGSVIKREDTSVPLSTNLGEMVDESLVKELSEFDVWSLNIYGGKSFGSHFETYKKRSSKPLFLGEFGVDAFNTKANSPDTNAQAVADEALIRELDANLSATNPDNVLIGGALFEWNDEWWKSSSGRPDTQETTGIYTDGGPYPDSEFNEEWWGIVDIDRNPRPVYEKVKALWKK